MKIEKVWVEPDQAVLGQLLQIKTCLHNDTAQKVDAMVNATLLKPGLRFPTSKQQLRVELKTGERQEALLFQVFVNERFQPGQYKVRVWLAGWLDSVVEKEFTVEPDADFKKDF